MGEPVTASRQRQVLVAMTLANAMILVDQTAVPLALPDVMQTFGVGSAAVQWVLNASLLALAGLLVLGGRLAVCWDVGGCSCSAARCSPGLPRSPDSRRYS